MTPVAKEGDAILNPHLVLPASCPPASFTPHWADCLPHCQHCEVTSSYFLAISFPLAALFPFPLDTSTSNHFKNCIAGPVKDHQLTTDNGALGSFHKALKKTTS